MDGTMTAASWPYSKWMPSARSRNSRARWRSSRAICKRCRRPRTARAACFIPARSSTGANRNGDATASRSRTPRGRSCSRWLRVMELQCRADKRQRNPPLNARGGGVRCRLSTLRPRQAEITLPRRPSQIVISYRRGVTAMADFRERLGEPDLIRFYDYWVSLRGDRAMPSCTDVDPSHIPPEFLPNLMLIDVFHAPRRYRYRLIGTQVVAATGEDRTGQAFENVGFFKAHPVVLEQYNCVARTGRPLHSLEPFTNFATSAIYDVDRLLLPLSGDNRTVD